MFYKFFKVIYSYILFEDITVDIFLEEYKSLDEQFWNPMPMDAPIFPVCWKFGKINASIDTSFYKFSDCCNCQGCHRLTTHSDKKLAWVRLSICVNLIKC